MPFPARLPILAVLLAGLVACGPEEPPPEPRGVPPNLAPTPQPPVKSAPPPKATGVLPLAQVLRIAQRAAPGEVIEVELDEDDEDMEYEVKILTPEGRRIELKIDARTGAITEREED
jgi:hypothetical protein